MALTGADGCLQVATAHELDVCFANPGTTEMPLMAALDRQTAIQTVPCLFEGVCSGAADGYARLAGKPALTLTHLGPGFANALANLHNARRARSPIVNLIGEHASWHRGCDSPLDTDILALARIGSHWAELADPQVETSIAETIEAAKSQGGQIASLIVPSDYWWQSGSEPAASALEPGNSDRKEEPLDCDKLETIAQTLRGQHNVALLLGGDCLRDGGLELASRYQQALGWTLLSETFPAHARLGRGYTTLERLAYLPDEARQQLVRFSHIVVAGAAPRVAPFGYPSDDPISPAQSPGNCHLIPATVTELELPGKPHQALKALDALANLLSVKANPSFSHRQRPTRPSGRLYPGSLAAALVYAQPQDAIVIDESLTSGASYYDLASSAAPFSYLSLTGGAIGIGSPCALGAAIACPTRPVINFQADGSALYTPQALWSQARLGLNVTTIICSNRKYNILQMEASRFQSAANTGPGDATHTATELTNPNLDWVQLAQGLGVPAKRVESAEQLADELRVAVREPGPTLIEVPL